MNRIDKANQLLRKEWEMKLCLGAKDLYANITEKWTKENKNPKCIARQVIPEIAEEIIHEHNVSLLYK